VIIDIDQKDKKRRITYEYESKQYSETASETASETEYESAEEDNFCVGCSEPEDDCCCQLCDGCDTINPEGQRHGFCKDHCEAKIAYEKGDVVYDD
jgi:hypothetical protein